MVSGSPPPAAESPASLPPGYELVEELARRPGVRVVRARLGAEERVLRLEARGAPGRGESASELAVLAAVHSPGIVPLADHGPLTGGGTFVARRWVPGRDLLAWSRGRSPEEIGAAVARLCPALAHLHRLGFVHGDLKPENVLVSETGEVLLVDFGLAHAQADAADLAERGVRGTPGALAPELLLGGAASARSDLFALGVLLHRSLVGLRRSPREFYGRFPASSYLDAAGTPPEELPSFARDLVVALTAREPSRRPRSAAEVGRTLAARLDLSLALPDEERALAWPAGQGRDPWLAAWLDGAREPGAADPTWLRVPAREDPVPFAEHLRVFLALRGIQSRGLELDAELTGVSDGVALDAWVERHGRATGGWLVLAARALDSWGRHALAALGRAWSGAARAPGERLVVVAAGAPPSSGAEGEAWAEASVPAVDAAWVEAFLRPRLAGPEPRLPVLAQALARLADGSATCLDELFARSLERGVLLPELERWRLRPGTAEELAATAAGPGTGIELSALPPAERELAEGLAVCGGRARLAELAELLGRAPQELARAALALRARGLLDGRRPGTLAFAPGGGPAAVEATRGRELHARRAALLERGGDPRAVLHAFAAAPGPARADALHGAVAALLDRGAAERALDLVERASEALARLGEDPLPWAGLFAVERAVAWCGLGRAELAERALEGLPEGDRERDPTLAARAHLVRGRIAALRGRGDEAAAELERAAALDPGLASEVLVERARRLHERGADRELLSLLEELDPRGAEARGELEPRRRAYLESLAAQSLFRLGEAGPARERTLALIDEAARLGDVGREAALRTNLATIERRSGSPERARAELERAAAAYERAGIVLGLARAHEALGGLLRELGDFVSAAEHVDAALGIRRRLGDREGAARVLGIAGLLAFDRGHAHAAHAALTASARAMEGAQRRRHVPLLLAKAAEVRARIGEGDPACLDEHADQEADPRILLAKARTAALLGLPERAGSYAARAEALARSLSLARVAREARFLGAWLAAPADPASAAALAGGAGALAEEDGRILAWIGAPLEGFDPAAAGALARELSERGRDDRAARLWTALAARGTSDEEADRAARHAAEAFEACAAGLSEPQREAFRLLLLGLPDPRPDDFTPRPRRMRDEELEMEIVSLLEINRQLVRQEGLAGLLGVIVENALSVTGAERGFLVLEEQGELCFDTALDSRRGDIAEPELEVSRSVVAEALRVGHAIRVGNAVDDPVLGHTVSVVSLELRSVLCVPFTVGDGLRGAIYLDHRLRTGAFDERAERLCALLADQAALAIRQVRRMEEIRALNRRLEERVASQESDLSTARRALRRAGRAASAGGMVGESAAMERVHALIERMAPSELPVLVTGASGTGKELAARSLHALSSRRGGPFVSESCAALPPTLIESALFGYVRGAFTGADRDHAGLFEEADGGTLFLDEIGELPLELQAKLLRVFETGEVRRLGASESSPVDFRLLAATNRDLAQEVRGGGFREDLYYRLDALHLALPTLDERTEDVPLLVEHFLELEAEERGGARRRVSRAVLARLTRRGWPGNVRELRNEVARLCVLSEGDLEDPELVRPPGPSVERGQQGDVPVTLAELERHAILDALARTGGDKREAARLLGISRAKIYQRLKAWGVE